MDSLMTSITGAQEGISLQQESAQHTVPDLAPGIDAIFSNEFPEVDEPVQVISGNVPDFVRGTYYLNGPARFGMHEFRYRHWLDGDGMVTRLHFQKSEIHLKSRYVQSNKFTDERKAGRPVYRTFGTAFEGSQLNNAKNGLESPVNVSAYRFGDKLLAFGEQGLPWLLNPETLETGGQFTFNKRLNDASPFSAHPKFDPDSGEMFNFGIFFSAQSPKLYFYCFTQEGLRYRKALPLEYPCSVHDFALSRNYAVFFLSPYLLNAQNLVQDGSTIIDSLRWEPMRGSRLMIVSRSNGELIASLPIGNRYCLHLINAFDQENTLTADVLEFDGPIYGQYQPIPHLYQDIQFGGPVRFTVDLKNRELMERKEMPYKQSPDFPAIDTRLSMARYEDFWMLGISSAGKPGRKFFDQLVHANWAHLQAEDIYQCPPMHYLGGEPIFIPDPGAAGGAIICQEFDAHDQKTYFVLFDAFRVSAGPVAKIAINQPFYLGFHASFHSDAGI